MTARVALVILSAIGLMCSARADVEPFSRATLGKSIAREFGSVRQDYFAPGLRVSAQISMGMGVPNPTMRVADGNYLVSGCRPHSCDEKTAVIATPAGLMLGAGIIYFSCGREPGNLAVNCDLTPHLRIFMTKKAQPALAKELQGWAEHEGYKGAAETKNLP